MGWLKLDDCYDDHPKIVEAGHEAAWLDIRGMLFCARQETNGHIPAAQLKRIGSDFGEKKRKELVDRLVTVGRWREDQDGDGWWVHDYLNYNPSSTKRESEREAARERMRRARGHRSGEPTGGDNDVGSEDVRANTPPNSGENFEQRSPNPDPTPPGITPPTPPPSGGINPRANGTNPRAIAARARATELQERVAACATCGTAAWTCDRCARIEREISELLSGVSA